MADNTAQLLLQVDASTELLRRNLAAARADIDGFSAGAVASAKKAETGLSDMGNGAGFARGQMLELTHVGKSLFDQIAAGQSPVRALSVEFGRIGQIVAGSGGVGPALSSMVTLLGGPVAVGFEVAGLAAAGLAYHFISASHATLDLEGAEKLLAKRQADLKDYFNETTGAINTQITATERLAKIKALGGDGKTFSDNSAAARKQLFTAADVGASPQTAGSERGMPIPVPFDDSASKASIRALTTELQAGKVTLDQYGQALAKLGASDASIQPLTSKLIGLAATAIEADRDLAKANAQMAEVNGTATAQQKALLGIVEPGKSAADIIARVSSANDKGAKAQAAYNLEIERLTVAFNGGHGILDQPGFEAGIASAKKRLDDVKAGIEATKDAQAAADKAAREAREQTKRDLAALAAAARAVANIKPEPTHFGDTFDTISDELDHIQEQIDKHKLKLSFEVQTLQPEQVVTDLQKSFEVANKAEDKFASGLASTLSRGIFESGNLGDALSNAFKRAGESLVESGILDLLEGKAGPTGKRSGGVLDSLFSGGGGGGIGGILGSLFGGAHADGGVPPAGKISLVGERGPELIVGNGVANVVPLKQSSPGVMSGGSGKTEHTINVVVHTNENFDAMVQGRATSAVAGAAPLIINASVARTFERMSRRGIPGSRG